MRGSSITDNTKTNMFILATFDIFYFIYLFLDINWQLNPLEPLLSFTFRL